MKKVVQQVGLDAGDKQIELLFQKIHLEQTDLKPQEQLIDYTEFIGRALVCKKQITKGKLFKLFKQFTGRKEFFNEQDLKNFFARKGRKFSSEALCNLMQEANLTKSGRVYFEQFLNIMDGEYLEQTTKVEKDQSEQLNNQIESFSGYQEFYEQQQIKNQQRANRKARTEKKPKKSQFYLIKNI
eukprot:TRINITY_DN22635_c0_g1_i1.p3 TRINITY_DN22635_c0_g1~~TRINITY_DN22635_c0_g1_i1.p3  ORF type:complete len:184 (+),score=43.37 TRINITY_DN22635_c0_g1_i1:933-1484(+)